MGQYNIKGLYNGYKKNNKEREALDYYSTPTKEVENILAESNITLKGKTILEPCVGGGHMLQGIVNYLNDVRALPHKIIATDVMNRNPQVKDESNKIISRIEYSLGKDYDFLSDNYPYDKADIVIMNPPYSTIEPFVIRALEIAPEVLLLGRMQFLESESRFNNILKNNPFNEMYQYVDRIQCYKNGDETISGSSAQGYAWFYWNKNYPKLPPYIKWLRRSDKQ